MTVSDKAQTPKHQKQNMQMTEMSQIIKTKEKQGQRSLTLRWNKDSYWRVQTVIFKQMT